MPGRMAAEGGDPPRRSRFRSSRGTVARKRWATKQGPTSVVLAGSQAFNYFLEWIQARFMEMEVSKISQMTTELFKRCKRRQDQPVREFNVEFERLVLRLHEVRCTKNYHFLPPSGTTSTCGSSSKQRSSRTEASGEDRVHRNMGPPGRAPTSGCDLEEAPRPAARSPTTSSSTRPRLWNTTPPMRTSTRRPSRGGAQTPPK